MPNLSTDYERINYYHDPDQALTGTMQYLHWFRFFVRNADLHMRVPSSDSQSVFPCKFIRIFIIMRSTEATHLPCTYTVRAPAALTYLQWCDIVFELPTEREVKKILRKEGRTHLGWQLYEFVGWTSDGLLQNPEENKQAFRFEGHLTESLRKIRNQADD